MTVTLDDKDHIYRLEDGRTPPSVSQVLNWALPMPSQFIPEFAKEMGTARHLWYEAISKGLELENEPDPRIAGAVEGFRKFWAEVKPVYHSSEVPYFDPLLGVCGKPDLVAEISGRLSVLDYKPATKNKRTAIQSGAYALMLRRNGVNVLDRFEVRLADGSYRLEKHTDDGDLRRWPALVAGFFAATFYGR